VYLEEVRQAPDGPTCPVCIQRLEGIPPRVTDLHATPFSGMNGVNVVRVIDIPDDEMTFELYHQMDRKKTNIPITLARTLRGDADAVLVTAKNDLLLMIHGKFKMFPSAEQLFSCNGYEQMRNCAFPGAATAVGSNEDLHSMAVETFNNKVYYAALGCWLRWARQFLRNGLAEA